MVSNENGNFLKDGALCWREVLSLALCGIYPYDTPLEKMIDHLERMS